MNGSNLNVSYHTKCGHNFSAHWYDPSSVILRDGVFRTYQAKLVIIPTIFGIILTILYIVAVYRCINSHRVSKKFYALLMNRAIGDLVACIVSVLIIFYILFSSHVNSHVMQLFSTLFIGCFWSAMVSYIALGFLKLYGIARPLHYRDRVTVRRTVHLIVLSWIAFLVLVFMTMSAAALSKIELFAEWSGCRTETCLHDVYIIRNGATSLIYFITLICFVITVILIKRAQKFAKSLHQASDKSNGTKSSKTSKVLKKRFRFPLIKLTLNVITFAIFHLPYTIWATFLVFADGCFYLLHYNKMQIFMGFVRFSLLIRIVLDAIISFATDKELRLALIGMLGSTARIIPRNFSTNFRSSISVGEISTDSNVAGAERSRNSCNAGAGTVREKACAMRSNTMLTIEGASEIPDSIQRAKSVKIRRTNAEDIVAIDSLFEEVDFRAAPKF